MIRAWADYPWPTSVKQALTRLRDELGWSSASNNERILTTSLAPEEKNASFTPIRRKGVVANFRIRLTNRVPDELIDDAFRKERDEAFEAYVSALTEVYGKGKRKRKTKRGSTEVVWKLDSGASILLGMLTKIIDVNVDSPDYNEALAGEAAYFKEYGSDENV